MTFIKLKREQSNSNDEYFYISLDEFSKSVIFRMDWEGDKYNQAQHFTEIMLPSRLKIHVVELPAEIFQFISNQAQNPDRFVKV